MVQHPIGTGNSPEAFNALIKAVERITNGTSVETLSQDILTLREAMVSYRQANPDYWKAVYYESKSKQRKPKKIG